MEKIFLTNGVRHYINQLETAGGKPLYELTPEEARKVLLNVQNTKVKIPDIQSDTIEINTTNKRKMSIKIIRPQKNKKRLPVIFYIHGGGWVMGNDRTHARLTAELAVKTQAAVVFPIYTPSPEAQFPEITDDLFIALQHISASADKYNIDTTRLAVAGDSVGGNMAIALCLLAKKNENNPPITCQALFYPVTNAAFDNSSYQTYADGPWLTKKAMEWFWMQYAPNEKDRQNILASPLQAKPDELKGLPPALIITDENDVLRDEGEAFAQKLNKAGVDVVSLRFAGTIHDFMMLNPLAETPPSRAAVILAAAYLHQALHSQDILF